jgi:hypothetical protein
MQARRRSAFGSIADAWARTQSAAASAGAGGCVADAWALTRRAGASGGAGLHAPKQSAATPIRAAVLNRRIDKVPCTPNDPGVQLQRTGVNCGCTTMVGAFVCCNGVLGARHLDRGGTDPDVADSMRVAKDARLATIADLQRVGAPPQDFQRKCAARIGRRATMIIVGDERVPGCIGQGRIRRENIHLSAEPSRRATIALEDDRATRTIRRGNRP